MQDNRQYHIDLGLKCLLTSSFNPRRSWGCLTPLSFASSIAISREVCYSLALVLGRGDDDLRKLRDEKREKESMKSSKEIKMNVSV